MCFNLKEWDKVPLRSYLKVWLWMCQRVKCDYSCTNCYTIKKLVPRKNYLFEFIFCQVEKSSRSRWILCSFKAQTACHGRFMEARFAWLKPGTLKKKQMDMPSCFVLTCFFQLSKCYLNLALLSKLDTMRFPEKFAALAIYSSI